MKNKTSKRYTRVRTPFSRYFTTIRRKILPLGVWGLAIAALVPLMHSQYHGVNAVGVAERNRTSVVPLLDGKIEEIAVQVFDEVKEGDVVALLDDSLLEASINTAHAELSRLRAKMEAERQSMGLSLAATLREAELDEINDLRRFQVNEEEARLDLLDRITEQEANRVNLARLEIQLKRQTQLLAQRATSQDRLDEISYEKEALKIEIEENEKAIALARENMAEASRRREERTLTATLTTATFSIEPFMAAVQVQEAEIYELMETKKLVVLRSPMTGTVVNINASAGENVTKGTVLMEINAPSTNRVLAFVGEAAAADLSQGGKVKVYSRRQPRETTVATILKVGDSVEMYPVRLQANPNMVRWGIPVLVGQIPEGRFFPGEILDLKFSKASGAAF